MTFIYSRSFIHPFHGFIWNQHNGQLPVGLLAQLVGHSTGIAEVMGSNPVQAWIFFRPYFHYYSSSVHNCEDHFHIHVQVLLLTDRLWSIYTLLRDRNLIFQPFVLILKRSDCVFSFRLFNVCRAAVGFNWICAFWGSAELPEKELWIKWHLLQRPGYETANKSDVTTADEICDSLWGFVVW